MANSPSSNKKKGVPSILLSLATHAKNCAYAPYSHFQVGAAIQTSDGKTFSGANVENASYGLSVCAERNAIMQAVLSDSRTIQTLVVITNTSPPSPPCGMCLQVLSEFANDCEIFLINPQQEQIHTSLEQLFPIRFDKSRLSETSK